MKAYAKIENRSYTGEMPSHYATVIIGDVSISAMNLVPSLVWDKQFVDLVVSETVELAKHIDGWMKMSDERLCEVINSEVAVNRAARLGRYDYPVPYFSEWLENQLKNSMYWMKSSEDGKIIAALLMALACQTYDKRNMKFTDGYRKGWECAVAFHRETQFIEDAARLFA